MSRDQRLVLTVGIKVGKKVLAPAKRNIRNQEELRQTLADCLSFLAEDPEIADEDRVSVVAQVQRPGFKPGMAQEIPVLPSKITDERVLNFLNKGLIDQISEDGKPTFEDSVKAGVEKVETVGKTVWGSITKLRAVATGVQVMTGSASPTQMISAVRDVVAAEGLGVGGNGPGDGNALMSMIGELLSDPDNAGQKVQALLGSDPNLAPLAGLLGNLLK